MQRDERCLFCKIVDQKIPSQNIYEDEHIYAFKDIQPQAPFHVLFVPKMHIESLATLTEAQLAQMSFLYKAITYVVEKEGLKQTGFRTVINTGQHGGQTIFHLHVHLLAGKQLGGNMAGV